MWYLAWKQVFLTNPGYLILTLCILHRSATHFTILMQCNSTYFTNIRVAFTAATTKQMITARCLHTDTAYFACWIDADTISLCCFFRRTLNKMIGLMMRSVTWNPFPIMCEWFLACFTSGVNLLDYRYVQIWIIAKRWKQRPVNWFLESLQKT